MSAGRGETITIRHDREIAIDEVLRVARDGAKVALEPETAALLDARRAEVLAYVDETDSPAYGFNRGFGHNVKLAVGRTGTRALQENLILSHACGVGAPAPREIVRGAMLLRAQSLARGHSGVRALVVRALVDALNADIVPVVPRYGSVAASGDLAPLSHIALGLLGHGEVDHEGSVVPAREALESAGIEPLRLDMKEGLALNNGVQYTTAIGIHCVDRMSVLIETAAVATAVSAQVMLGADTPFRPDLHALRPHAGAVKVAGWIWEMMKGSPIREAHRPYDVDGQIQDPYNIRCAAQILGACLELVERARATLTTEANSVTDNPLLLPAGPEFGDGAYTGQHVEVVSGGHFHGMPVAVDVYGLLQAMGIAASLSNTRCARYVDEARNKGLGSDLKWPGATTDPALMDQQATWSGMMIPEYVSAGLTNWIWGAAMPTHLMSISTDAGQEDHVSMGANVALRVLDNLPRLAEVLAVELAFGAQAAAIRKAMDHIPSRAPTPEGDVIKERHPWSPDERYLSASGEAVLDVVYDLFPPVTQDRLMSDELQLLAERILDGTVLAAARKV